MAGAESDRAGRVRVLPNLTVAGHENIFVIGDTALVEGPDGKPVPGIAPAAKQQGAYVAKVIRSRTSGKAIPAPFRYRHQGNLATIGRGAAVVDMGRIKLKALLPGGYGDCPYLFLIGTRSRAAVAWSWLWTFISGQHSARLITQGKAAEDNK